MTIIYKINDEDEDAIKKFLEESDISYEVSREEGRLEQITTEENKYDFYLPAQNKDRTFNISDALDYLKESESVYGCNLLTQRGSYEKMEFEILNNKKIHLRTLNLPDGYLSPACESKNSLTKFDSKSGTFNINEKICKIKNLSKGIARKGDKLWIIEKPCEIEYQ